MIYCSIVLLFDFQEEITTTKLILLFYCLLSDIPLFYCSQFDLETETALVCTVVDH